MIPATNINVNTMFREVENVTVTVAWTPIRQIYCSMVSRYLWAYMPNILIQ